MMDLAMSHGHLYLCTLYTLGGVGVHRCKATCLLASITCLATKLLGTGGQLIGGAE